MRTADRGRQAGRQSECSNVRSFAVLKREDILFKEQKRKQRMSWLSVARRKQDRLMAEEQQLRTRVQVKAMSLITAVRRWRSGVVVLEDILPLV